MTGTGNPFAGEVAVWLDGTCWPAKLTLGALAELEAELEAVPGVGVMAGSAAAGEGETAGGAGLAALVGRIGAGEIRAADILALIRAGLRGGGWRGSREDLLSAEIAAGPVGTPGEGGPGGGPAGGLAVAAGLAVALLARAFGVPGGVPGSGG